MNEGEPKSDLNFEKDENGDWVYAAQEAIADIDGFETMEPEEKITALVTVMKELSAENTNRFIVEELARRVEAIKLYAEIEANKEKIARLDVYV